jgi:hypothetical protein
MLLPYYQVEATLTANVVDAPCKVSDDVFLTNSTEFAVIVNVPLVVPPESLRVTSCMLLELFTSLTSVANPRFVAEAKFVSEPFNLTAAIINPQLLLFYSVIYNSSSAKNKKREH